MEKDLYHQSPRDIGIWARTLACKLFYKAPLEVRRRMAGLKRQNPRLHGEVRALLREMREEMLRE